MSPQSGKLLAVAKHHLSEHPTFTMRLFSHFYFCYVVAGLMGNPHQGSE